MCVILLHLMACGVRQGHEWEVKIDDGSNAVVHRTELVLAAMEETEETYEASKIGRRRQTNRDHSVSPALTCALSFVREVCVFLEMHQHAACWHTLARLCLCILHPIFCRRARAQ